MKTAIVIELSTEDDCVVLSNALVERNVERALKTFLDTYGYTVTHLEAESGSLHEAFGIEQYEAQKAVLEQQLTDSLKVKS